MAVVPSASQLFDEPEAQKAVAQHAVRWCSRDLVAHRQPDQVPAL